MMQRVRQFFRAVRAHLAEEDHAYVRGILPPPAQQLFYAMDVIDQYHALQVARTAQHLAEAYGAGEVRQELLLRSALLHDVGRQKGDMGLWGKVLAVLLYAFFPARAAAWARPCAGRRYRLPQHVLYVYRHHPAIGAAKIRAIGMGEEAAIVLRHHQPPTEDAPLELLLLQRADEQN